VVFLLSLVANPEHAVRALQVRRRRSSSAPSWSSESRTPATTSLTINGKLKIFLRDSSAFNPRDPDRSRNDLHFNGETIFPIFPPVALAIRSVSVARPPLTSPDPRAGLRVTPAGFHLRPLSLSLSLSLFLSTSLRLRSFSFSTTSVRTTAAARGIIGIVSSFCSGSCSFSHYQDRKGSRRDHRDQAECTNPHKKLKRMGHRPQHAR